MTTDTPTFSDRCIDSDDKCRPTPKAGVYESAGPTEPLKVEAGTDPPWSKRNTVAMWLAMWSGIVIAGLLAVLGFGYARHLGDVATTAAQNTFTEYADGADARIGTAVSRLNETVVDTYQLGANSAPGSDSLNSTLQEALMGGLASTLQIDAAGVMGSEGEFDVVWNSQLTGRVTNSSSGEGKTLDGMAGTVVPVEILGEWGDYARDQGDQVVTVADWDDDGLRLTALLADPNTGALWFTASGPESTEAMFNNAFAHHERASWVVVDCSGPFVVLASGDGLTEDIYDQTAVLESNQQGAVPVRDENDSRWRVVTGSVGTAVDSIPRGDDEAVGGDAGIVWVAAEQIAFDSADIWNTFASLCILLGGVAVGAFALLGRRLGSRLRAISEAAYSGAPPDSRGLVELWALGSAVNELQNAANTERTGRMETEKQLGAMHMKALTDWENDRRRAAQELHDGPLQTTTAIGWMLEGETPPDPQLLREATVEMRQIIAGLLADDVVAASLPDRLSELIDDAGDSDVAVTAGMVKPVDVDAPTARMLLRSARELMTNAQRHSGGSLVEVRLWEAGDWVHLEVKDNGVGFVDIESPEDHFGLLTIRTEAEQVGGTLTVTTSSLGGSEVKVSVPSLHNGPRRGWLGT